MSPCARHRPVNTAHHSRFSRLGQNINVPVKLTYDLNPFVLAGALALPAGTYCAVHFFYLETRQKDSLKRWVSVPIQQITCALV